MFKTTTQPILTDVTSQVTLHKVPIAYRKTPDTLWQWYGSPQNTFFPNELFIH